jgi:hypothetical protein
VGHKPTPAEEEAHRELIEAARKLRRAREEAKRRREVEGGVILSFNEHRKATGAKGGVHGA